MALLLQKNGRLHRPLKVVLTWDIVRKLKGQRHELNRRYTTTWGGREKLDDDEEDDDDDNNDEVNKDDEYEI